MLRVIEDSDDDYGPEVEVREESRIAPDEANTYDQGSDNDRSDGDLDAGTNAGVDPADGLLVISNNVGTSHQVAGRQKRYKHFLYTDLSPLFHLPVREARLQLQIGNSKFKDVCRKASIKDWPYRPIRQLSKNIEYYRSLALNSSISSDEKRFASWSVSKLLHYFERILVDPVALSEIEEVLSAATHVPTLKKSDRSLYMAAQMAKSPEFSAPNQIFIQSEELYRNAMAAMASESTNRYSNINHNGRKAKRGANNSGDSSDDVDQDDFDDFANGFNRSAARDGLNTSDNNRNYANNSNDISSDHINGRNNNSSGSLLQGSSSLDSLNVLRDIPMYISKVDLKYSIVRDNVNNNNIHNNSNSNINSNIETSPPRIVYEAADITLPELLNPNEPYWAHDKDLKPMLQPDVLREFKVDFIPSTTCLGPRHPFISDLIYARMYRKQHNEVDDSGA